MALASKNVYALTINSKESAIYTINFGGNTNVLAEEGESITLTVSSDGEMNLNNTRFVELKIWKKKPVIIKER